MPDARGRQGGRRVRVLVCDSRTTSAAAGEIVHGRYQLVVVTTFGRCIPGATGSHAVHKFGHETLVKRS